MQRGKGVGPELGNLRDSLEETVCDEGRGEILRLIYSMGLLLPYLVNSSCSVEYVFLCQALSLGQIKPLSCQG